MTVETLGDWYTRQTPMVATPSQKQAACHHQTIKVMEVANTNTQSAVAGDIYYVISVAPFLCDSGTR